MYTLTNAFAARLATSTATTTAGASTPLTTAVTTPALIFTTSPVEEIILSQVNKRFNTISKNLNKIKADNA
ncbi:hypothetical protein HDV64DRAFT_280652 [Trichoderma sp. TUCIM 5745]